MRQVKRYHRFTWQIELAMISWLGGLFFIIWRTENAGQGWDVWKTAEWVSLAIWGILVVIWSVYRWTHFRCPDCGRVIGGTYLQIREPATPGSPIYFVCDHCDLEWEIGSVGSG